MNWIGKIPQLLLYPIDWYLTATEWIAANPQKTFWIALALIVAALVF